MSHFPTNITNMQSRHSNSHSPDEATGLPQTAPEAEVHCPSSWQLAQGPLENHVMLILLEHVCASVSLKLKKYARHQETTGQLRGLINNTHPFNGPFSGTTQVSRYQKGTTNLDFNEARDSEWQWHQLGHMQVCTSLQTDNHASTPPLCFLQAGCPSCRPTNSVTEGNLINK